MRGSRCSLFAATWVLSLVTSLAAHAGDFVFRNGFDPGFQVQTPDITVAPGETATYCYYFRTPNMGSAGIRRWSSLMQPGMHHLILYAAYGSGWQPLERQPPGTLTQTTCGLAAGGGNPAWIYAAHERSEELVFPDDDGSGAPLAVELLPNQPVFLQMYVFNAGSDPITTSALLEAESLGVAYTKTATYLTVNTNLSIPPNVTGYLVTETCAVPPDVRFWWLSTRTHHFAMLSEIEDATSDLAVHRADFLHVLAERPHLPMHVRQSDAVRRYERR